MSASEKLRSLVFQGGLKMKNGHGVTIRDMRPEIAEQVLAALPLIADVVEAAEETTDAWFMPSAGQGILKNRNRRQLAALTALREHLEGGDVT